MLASSSCALGTFAPLYSCKPSRRPLSQVSLSLSLQSTPSRLQTSQRGDALLPITACRVFPQPLLWTHNMDCTCCAHKEDFRSHRCCLPPSPLYWVGVHLPSIFVSLWHPKLIHPGTKLGLFPPVLLFQNKSCTS